MSVLNASRREKSGAKPSKLRKQGMIPMGLVERSHQTLPLQISKQAFKEAMSHGGHTQVDVAIEGEREPRRAIVKQIDYDGLRGEVLHITLQEVLADDMIKMDVPLVGVGENEEAKGEGVTLTQVLDHLKLRGKVSDMPERLTVDISGLQAGQSMTAAEVEIPEGIELLSAPDLIVFTNTIVREPELEAPVEAPEETGVPEDTEPTAEAESSE